MRTLSDVNKIKQQASQNSTESAVTGLPPGYIFGLDLNVRGNDVYIAPGVASIRGKLITIQNEIKATSDMWLVSRRPSTSYFAYLSQLGKITIERVAPAVEKGQYYSKNPATGARFLGGLQTDDSGRLLRVISRDPIYIGAGATFEPGYDPSDKLDSVGGRYSSSDGDRSKLEIFPDSDHALRVRRWDDVAGKYRDVLKVMVNGENEGDIIIGRYDLGYSGAEWDESESTFKVRGSMYQEDGSPYPTYNETSKFFYGNTTPAGPYKAGDFWVLNYAIYISTEDRAEGEGRDADWIWFIRPNIVADVLSTNGNVFRPGQSTTTTLYPRVFKNGVEITNTLPDSAFSWKRKSFFPTSDDEVWNAAHQTGYRTIEVSTDTVEARATYTLEISE